MKDVSYLINKIPVFIIMIVWGRGTVCASSETFVKHLLDKNFPREVSVGMAEQKLIERFPNLLRTDSRSSSGKTVVNFFHRVSPNRFYWFKSVDKNIESLQLFNRGANESYTIEEGKFSEKIIRSMFDRKEKESIRLGKNQEINIQPLNFLNSRSDSINIVFTRSHDEYSVTIYDSKNLKLEDFFVPPAKRPVLENKLKNLKQSIQQLSVETQKNTAVEKSLSRKESSDSDSLNSGDLEFPNNPRKSAPLVGIDETNTLPTQVGGQLRIALREIDVARFRRQMVAAVVICFFGIAALLVFLWRRSSKKRSSERQS